jgi:hypothetical protein
VIADYLESDDMTVGRAQLHQVMLSEGSPAN